MKRVNVVLAAAAVGMLVAWPHIASAAPTPAALFARDRAAEGGNAWRSIAGIVERGTVTQAGAASPFVSFVDRQTGFSKTVTDIGSLHDIQGYDGVPWDFQGGSVTEQTLPGFRADNVTQAYVARDGWWNPKDPAVMTPIADDGVRVVPRDGSAIDVWFDHANGWITKTIAHTDQGPVTTALDDYRALPSGVVVPFLQTSIDPTHSVTLVQVTAVLPKSSVPASDLARPQPVNAGTIAGGASQAVVPFKLSGRPGAIYTSVRVGGRPALVIFDSGGANYFTPDGAKQLHLHGAGGLQLGGVGDSSANGSIAGATSIALGNAVLHEQHAIIGPLPYPAVREARGVTIAGLVGAEFLQSFRTTFDFIGKHATFARFGAPAAAPGGAVLPLLSDGQHAYVEASIDGVRGYYLLDTGDSGDITVFRRFADAHGLFKGRGLHYVSAGGIGGHLAYDRYRARAFTLAGAIMSDPPVTISEANAGAFASRSIAGNIGLRVIARYNITFDFRHARVALTPNATIHTPFAVDRSGFSASQPDATRFVVLSVIAGSPAARAGLATGDTIVAVDGHSIAAEQWSTNEISPYLTGTRSYTLTLRSAPGRTRIVRIVPRTLL